MTTLAVHPWPGPVPALRDGVFIIGVETSPQRARARAQIREALRQALAGVLGLQPESIGIASTPGKPPRVVLAGGAHNIGCSFAHENSYALAAVNLHGAIGVDLMRVLDIPDWQAVARDYLGPAASASLLDTSVTDRPGALAQMWTRREAALKCSGQQLSEWQADINGLTTTLAIPVPDLVGHIHTGDKQQ
ncbi:4'-phosphopantetheinyl transferase family protein [Duganella sp. CT11-25]|uniref:4'-phosphopantetheinyl transferase family protein n=1 Tax=unclassified Duganella TaxID=2636909 RepID=UPI0039AEBD26